MTKISKIYIGLIIAVFIIAISITPIVTVWSSNKQFWKVDTFIAAYALSIGFLSFKAITNLK